MDEVCYISYKYQPLNNFSEISIFLHKRLYIPPSFRKKIGAPHHTSFSKHPLFTTFSLFLKVIEVCNISSKCWLLNKVANKIFLRKTSYTLALFHRKSCALHSGNLLKTSTFYHVLSSFDIAWVCYISYKYQLPNNLGKYQYFYKRDFVSLLHFEKIGALHRQSFSKHPLFTSFSLFLKVSEVCNISSKCWLPNKFSLSQKTLRSPSQNLFKTSTFYHSFTSVDIGWGVFYFIQIPNIYQPYQ